MTTRHQTTLISHLLFNAWSTRPFRIIYFLPISSSIQTHINMGCCTPILDQSIHDFTVKDAKGRDVEISTYEGKVLLIVNVASKCSFASPHYTQLTKLRNKFKDKGFEVLAFPCNQFLYQQPGSNQDVHKSICTRFKAEFPIFGKVKVNGKDAAPIYKFLKASKGGCFGSSIKWNFTKFLIQRDGRVFGRYGTVTFPLMMESDIRKALAKV